VSTHLAGPAVAAPGNKEGTMKKNPKTKVGLPVKTNVRAGGSQWG
jgi:hypothetical protein